MRPDGDPTQWTSWDYAIGTAMQIIEDGTTEQGHLIWEASGDDVYFDAIRKTNKAQAAIDRITNQEGYKSRPGEYFITEMHQQGVEPGEEKFPTRREWIAAVAAESALGQPSVD